MAVGQTENFLEGIDVRDPEFEDWLTLERQAWLRRLEETGFAHDLVPKAKARAAISAALPRTMLTQPGVEVAGSGAAMTQPWRVAMLPPIILGGDLRVMDLGPTPSSDLIGSYARLPE